MAYPTTEPVEKLTVAIPSASKLSSSAPAVWANTGADKPPRQANAKGTHISREAVWFRVEIDGFMRLVVFEKG